MEFGVLFTSHPNPQEEPYPHRDVHARTTDEIVEAERLGYDTAWIAEHHFATSYGIMPDCFAYMAYLAARTSRIKLASGVITLPLYDPIRVVENANFVDILSNGRVMLGIGSGYRPYEFEGLGKDFDGRRDMVEEAVGLMFEPSIATATTTRASISAAPWRRPTRCCRSPSRCRIRRSTWPAAPTARSATAGATASA